MDHSKQVVLIIEDDDIEFLIITKAINTLNMQVSIKRANNGREALHFLKDNHQSACMVILDLNMPVMGGMEFLTIIKSDPETKSIPVVILTNSENPEDRKASAKLGAMDFLEKPIGFPEYIETIEKINWQLCH